MGEGRIPLCNFDGSRFRGLALLGIKLGSSHSLSFLFLFLSSSSPCRRKRVGRSFKYEYIACRDRRRGADEHSAEQAETILQRRGDKFIPSRGRRATPPRPPPFISRYRGSMRKTADGCVFLPLPLFPLTKSFRLFYMEASLFSISSMTPLSYEAVTRGPGMLMLYGNAVDEVCSNSFECVYICRVSQNSRK